MRKYLKAFTMARLLPKAASGTALGIIFLAIVSLISNRLDSYALIWACIFAGLCCEWRRVLGVLSEELSRDGHETRYEPNTRPHATD